MAKLQDMIVLINRYTGIGTGDNALFPVDEFHALFELVDNKIYADESLKHGTRNALELL